MQQFKSGTDTAYWSLACQVQVNQYRLSHLYNLGEFKEQVDGLLDLTLRGLQQGQLTPKFVAPSQLHQYVSTHDVFTNTIYEKNPQYLYQV